MGDNIGEYSKGCQGDTGRLDYASYVFQHLNEDTVRLKTGTIGPVTGPCLVGGNRCFRATVFFRASLAFRI